MNKKEQSIFNKGIAIGMRINNSSRSDIKEVTGLSRWTQKRTEDWTELGQQPLERKQGSGRPKSLNLVNGRKILNAVKKNMSLSLRGIQQDQNLNKNGYCLQTIANFVHENGYQSVRKRKKFILSEHYKKQRLSFCEDMIKKNDDDLLKLCWSDECKITLDSIGIQFTLKRDEEDWSDYRFIYENKKCANKTLIIWAMIDQKGLIRMKWLKCEKGKKIDSEYYINEVLKKHVLIFKQFQTNSKEQWIYQQDNAPIHNSKATKIFLSENTINYIDWPSRSPDLNPIENIWPWLKRKISNQKSKFKNSDEIWDELDRLTDLPEFIEVCKNCCQSFKKRLQECIQKKGDIIYY